MSLIIYWTKDGHQRCQKLQYIQYWSCVIDQKESHFCIMWNGILYSPNYYSILNPILLPFHDLTAIIRYGFQQPQFTQDSDSLVKMQAAKKNYYPDHMLS